MKKLVAALCAGVIGAGSLVVPAGAQELPETQELPVTQVAEGDAASQGEGVAEDSPTELSSLSSAGSSEGDGSAEGEGFIIAALATIGVTGAAAAGATWAAQQGLIPNPLPGILPGSAAPVPSAPAPAPAPTPTPVLYNCSFGEAEVRPDHILLYCGDGHSALDGITWYSWGVNGASGRAVLRELTCVPNCATGGATRRWVDFTLGGIEWHNGEPRFTRAYLEGREYRID